MVYAKRPFGGPEAVLAYLSRYTHRVAIANSRLIAFDDAGVTFKWKDYRVEGSNEPRVMTLAVDEFIRRFLIHVLPSGFHRIRHYGLFAKWCAENIARARQLLAVAKPQAEPTSAAVDHNKPTLSMLRRSHDHHRGVRARCNATASADSSNERHQDRHLVTASQSCKSARHARWLSTSHGKARSDYPSIVANRPTIRGVRRHPITHSPAASPSHNFSHRLDPQSTSSPAALKSPYACRTTLRTLRRGFLPWRLSDASRQCMRASLVSGRHPKPFTTTEVSDQFDRLVEGCQPWRFGSANAFSGIHFDFLDCSQASLISRFCFRNNSS